MKRRHIGAWLLGCCAAIVLTAGQASAFQAQDNAAEEQDRSGVESADQNSHSGQFAGLADGKFQMTIDGENKHSHKVNDQTKVTINGKSAQLQDLKPGDKIEVTTNDENVALMVKAMRERGTQAEDPEQPERPERPRSDQAQPEQPERPELPAQADRPDEAQPQYRPRADQRRPLRDTEASRQQQPVSLGVRLGPSPTTGVLIQDVRPQSAAASAGLRSGDYILSVDGEKIESTEDFDRAMAGVQAGSQTQFEIWRNDQKQQVNVAFSQEHQSGFRGDDAASNQGQQRQGQQAQDQQRQDQAWIGVMLGESDQQQGVRIERIYPSGPAARAGLRSGDVVVRVSDQQIADPQTMADAIAAVQPGEQVELIVLRGGQEQTITVRPGNRSEFIASQPMEHQTYRQGESEFGDDVPDHAMMLEQHRRLAEQHQRLEERLDRVLDELQSIRQQLGGRQPGQPGQLERPGEQPGQPEAPAEPRQP